MKDSDDVASPTSTNTSLNFKRNYTTSQFYSHNPNPQQANYSNPPIIPTLNNYTDNNVPYTSASVHPISYYNNLIPVDVRYNNTKFSDNITFSQYSDEHLQREVKSHSIAYPNDSIAKEKNYKITGNNNSNNNFINIINHNIGNNNQSSENSKFQSAIQDVNQHKKIETSLVPNSNSNSFLNAFPTSLNSHIATTQYPLLNNQPIITNNCIERSRNRMDSINSAELVSISPIIGFEDIKSTNTNNSCTHQQKINDSKNTHNSLVNNTILIMNNHTNNDITNKNKSSLSSILNDDINPMPNSPTHSSSILNSSITKSEEIERKPLIIRLKTNPKANSNYITKLTSNSISKDKIKHIVPNHKLSNTVSSFKEQPIKKTSVRKIMVSPNSKLNKTGNKYQNLENIKNSIMVTLKLNNEKFKMLMKKNVKSDEIQNNHYNINDTDDKNNFDNRSYIDNLNNKELINTDVQNDKEPIKSLIITVPFKSQTKNKDPSKLTKTQNEIIGKNNSQIISSQAYKRNQLIHELNDNHIPHLPDGYAHLVMSPSGMLIPMELVDLNHKVKNVTAVRTIHENNKAIDIHEEDSDIEMSDDNTSTDNDNAKIATLNLYLLSKELKCNKKPFIQAESSVACSDDKVDYFNRLIEREDVEIIKNYKIERNNLQKLLNDLENSENLLSFENDLLELRDYELIKEELSEKYNNDQKYKEYLEYVLELQSLQCLDYSSRLIKFKNYLNMENERLKRNKNRLSKINGNKTHSIWKKFVKSNKKIQNTKKNDNNSNGISLISENDFILLTNSNSRSYGTYVLNNSVDKGNENQSEVIKLIEYFLPENCILRELYNEVKRKDYDPNNNFKHINIMDNQKKKDMISAYGLKEGSIVGANRLLKELQIDGMNVDIQKNERTDSRRSVGSRTSRKKNVEDDNVNELYDNDSIEFDNVIDTNSSNHGNRKGNNYRNSTRNTSINNIRKHRQLNSNSLTENENEFTDSNYQDNTSTDSLKQTDKSNNRKELNITSCLDTTLCDIDRVKMLNLNQHELVMGYTKVFGMPKGLHYEEIDNDLTFLRNHKK